MLQFFRRISLKHLVLLNVILNLVFFIAVRSWNPAVEKNTIVIRDAASYELLAENILHYHTFAGLYDTARIPDNSPELKASYLIVNDDTYREPGYPVFLALVYFITGIKPYFAIFLQLLLNALSLILIYKITLLLFNNMDVARIAGLLFAVDIHSIFVANRLLSETLFVFLFLISLYFFLSGFKKKKIWMLITSAIFLGVASLTRPVSIFYPLILIFLLLCFKTDSWKWVLQASLFYLIIVYSTMGLWVMRNRVSYRRCQLTTMSGYNLLMANVAITESRKTLQNIATVRTKFDVKCDSLGCSKMKNPFDRSVLCEKVAWNYIVKNKMAYAETQIWGAVHMFLSLGNIDMAQHLGWSSSNVDGQLIMDSERLEQNFSHKKLAVLGLLIILLLIIQYGGALCGLYFLIKNKKYFILVFSALTILYFSGMTGAIGKYRYKLPMQVIILSVSGYGYYSVLKHKIETSA